MSSLDDVVFQEGWLLHDFIGLAAARMPFMYAVHEGVSQGISFQVFVPLAFWLQHVTRIDG